MLFLLEYVGRDELAVTCGYGKNASAYFAANGKSDHTRRTVFQIPSVQSTVNASIFYTTVPSTKLKVATYKERTPFAS